MFNPESKILSRSAAILGLALVLSSHPDKTQATTNTSPATQTDECTLNNNTLWCSDFYIRRPFNQVSNVYDIYPYVHNPRSFSQWRDAATHGWANGLNYMGSRGCQVSDIDDSYIRGRRRVTVTESCIGELNSSN